MAFLAENPPEEQKEEEAKPLLEIQDMGHILNPHTDTKLLKVLRETEMKTEAWALGKDDPDIVEEQETSAELTGAPAKQALEFMRESEELKLQASKLEEQEASLHAQVGEFCSKAIACMQQLVPAPEPVLSTSTASEEPKIKHKWPELPEKEDVTVKETSTATPTTKHRKKSAPVKLEQGDLQKIFLMAYKTADYFDVFEAYPLVWNKAFTPKVISGTGSHIYVCTHHKYKFQAAYLPQVWLHITIIHIKMEAVCPFCAEELGIAVMHKAQNFTNPDSLRDHVKNKHVMHETSAK